MGTSHLQSCTTSYAPFGLPLVDLFTKGHHPTERFHDSHAYWE